MDSVLEIPEPVSVCDVLLDDQTVTKLRRHGNPSGTRLVMTHGNGLAIDLYFPFWSLLLDDFDLMIYDLRNHGWNSVGPQREHNVPTLIADHDRIVSHIERVHGSGPTVGVFHSFSALVSMMSLTDAYSALVLFDPPLCKPMGGEEEFDAAAERTASMARRRTERFRAIDELAMLLGFQPGLSDVSSEVRELMARATLRKRADGPDFELRCPRDYEAQIAEYVRSFAPLLDLDMLACPTKVVGADPTLPYAYLPTFNLSQAAAIDYDFVPDATHFLQLEKPAECAAILRAFLEEQGIH